MNPFPILKAPYDKKISNRVGFFCQSLNQALILVCQIAEQGQGSALMSQGLLNRSIKKSLNACALSSYLMSFSVKLKFYLVKYRSRLKATIGLRAALEKIISASKFKFIYCDL